MQMERESSLSQGEYEEYDLVYVPTSKAPLFMTQYPTQTREMAENLKDLLQVDHGKFYPIQKQLEMECTLQSGEYQNLKQVDYLDDDESEYQLKFTSKINYNRTNHFLAQLHQESKTVCLYAIDSVIQMRPNFEQQLDNLQIIKEDIQKSNIQALQRDNNLMKKHPDKYIENKLKNYNSFKQVLQSENPVELEFQESIQGNQYLSKIQNKPTEIVPLLPISRIQYLELLESGEIEQKN